MRTAKAYLRYIPKQKLKEVSISMTLKISYNLRYISKPKLKFERKLLALN
jgi:hypothetical protein